MRSIIIAFLVAATSSAFAQYPWLTANEYGIQNAFISLRENSQAMLELTGTDQFGLRVNTIQSDAFINCPLRSSTSSLAGQAEIVDYLNGVHTHRIVADGTTVWTYDYNRNEYGTSLYGAYGGPQPASALNTMLQELNRSSEGSSTFLARLFREVYGGDAAQYRTWLPAANTTVVTNGASMVDPVITTRTYQSLPGGLDSFVVYSYPSKPVRSSAFHMVWNAQTSEWNLSEIYYSDFQRINGSTGRTIDWKITVYPGQLPPAKSYQFVPPSNARPIANVKGQAGG